MTSPNLEWLCDDIRRSNIDIPPIAESGIRGVQKLRIRIDNNRKKVLNPKWGDGVTNLIDEFVNEFGELNFPDIKLPNNTTHNIVDLSEALDLTNGSVYGLDLTALSDFESFKYCMVSGLLYLRCVAGLDPTKFDTLVDVGIYNSALATKDLADKLRLRVVYGIPSSIPSNLIASLESDTFEVFFEDQKLGLNFTNACYKTLVNKLREDKKLEERSIYLGHSELGWVAMFPVVSAYKKVFDCMDINVDTLISPVGAGSFLVPFVLEGFAAETYIVEFAEYPVMARLHGNKKQVILALDQPDFPLRTVKEFDMQSYVGSRATITRKDEDNPFIPKDFWEKITAFIHSGISLGYKTLGQLHSQGLTFGVSTIETIGVAKQIAEEGKTVVVPLFERKLIDYSSDSI